MIVKEYLSYGILGRTSVKRYTRGMGEIFSNGPCSDVLIVLKASKEHDHHMEEADSLNMR